MASSSIPKTGLQSNGALDVLTIDSALFIDDHLYTIELSIPARSDLLAYDMYGDNRLWWVFAQRNLDVIEDRIRYGTWHTNLFARCKED